MPCEPANTGFPSRFSTGLHAGSNHIANSNPAHLTSLLLRHRNTRFVLFHGGFPYMGELAAVVKTFPNAYLDLCWMPMIAPTSAKLWLHQWLDAVPINKIFAFGGDTQTPEESYGHLLLTRRLIAEVLAEKVLAGSLSEADAAFVAARILRENAIEFYRLQRFSRTNMRLFAPVVLSSFAFPHAPAVAVAGGET